MVGPEEAPEQQNHALIGLALAPLWLAFWSCFLTYRDNQQARRFPTIEYGPLFGLEKTVMGPG